MKNLKTFTYTLQILRYAQDDRAYLNFLSIVILREQSEESGSRLQILRNAQDNREKGFQLKSKQDLTNRKLNLLQQFQ